MRYKKIVAEIALDWLAWTRDEINDNELIDRLDTVMRRRGVACAYPPCSQPTDVSGPFFCKNHVPKVGVPR